MANEQHSNDANPISLSTHSVDRVEPSSAISPDSAAQDQQAARNTHGSNAAGSADPSSLSTPGIEHLGPDPSVQPTSSQLLWNTPEGRIAGFRRMIRENIHSDHRDNLEALIRYYENGGKVPTGQEEIWAMDGEIIVGILTERISQLPADWFRRRKYCDVSHFYPSDRTIA